jgi:hypothetical protein
MSSSGVSRFAHNPEPIKLRKLDGLEGASLVAASENYEFFVPYVPAVVIANNYVDPLTVCRSVTGIPDDLIYWESPTQLVELGKIGNYLGLSSHIIFGISKQQWPTVEQHVRSISLNGAMSFDSDKPFVMHFGVQTVYMADPLASPVKHYDGPEDLKIKLNAFVLNSDFWGIILREHGLKKFGLPTFFRITVKQSLADSRSENFVKAVLDGVSPDESLNILKSRAPNRLNGKSNGN